MDAADADLTGSGAILFDLDPAVTSTPHLASVGGKQGNGYLVDRDNLPGALDRRPACSNDSTSDLSLRGPDTYGYYGDQPGPLNLFAPYQETCSNVDNARARSTPAYFQDGDGTGYVFFTGSTKNHTAAECNSSRRPPSVIRTRINTPGPDQPAYLSIDAADDSLVFKIPGSPVISSNGPDITTAIVWVLEPNVLRSGGLPQSVHPTLYAVNASDMQVLQVLYSTDSTQLNSGAKYNSPIVIKGVVYTGTDRITAFGLPPTDSCVGSPDPCCGSPDACCGSPDPCCGSPDPCCGSSDPCCLDPGSCG